MYMKISVSDNVMRALTYGRYVNVLQSIVMPVAMMKCSKYMYKLSSLPTFERILSFPCFMFINKINTDSERNIVDAYQSPKPLIFITSIIPRM